LKKIGTSILVIDAPHFCAGIVDGRAAPIIKYMVGWDIDRILEYCEHKGWKLTMRMVIKEVGPVTKEGKYFWYQIKYEDNGKEFTKKVMSFDEVPYKAFKGANPGDQFDVKIEKDANGYWKMKEVNVATGAAPVNNSVNGNARTYLPDDVRQKFIIRQSSLGHAVEFINSSVDAKDVTVSQVLDVAGDFEAWVNRE
jgi:hypothetical protein